MKISEAWVENRARYWLRIFVAGMLGLHVFVLWSARSQIRLGYGDFSIFYTAGKIVRSGNGARLYDQGLQYAVQKEFAPDVSVRQGALPYNHPPFEAVIFVPLTYLPYGYALAVWSAVNIGLVLLVGRALQRNFSTVKGVALWQWLAMMLAFYPVFISLMQGQDSILLLYVYVLTFESLQRRADFSSGCWLGLGIFRFPLALPTLLILLAWRRWRVAGGVAVVSLALSTLSVWVVGVNGLLRYPSYIWNLEENMGAGSISPALMSNVRGLLVSSLGDLVAPQWLLFLILIASVLLLWVALAAGFAPGTFELKFALAIVVTVSVSYHSYSYDWCLLILPLVIVEDHCWRVRPGPLLKKFAPLLPVVPVLISPVLFLSWLRWHNLSWLAVPLLVWVWALRREIWQVQPLDEAPTRRS